MTTPNLDAAFQAITKQLDPHARLLSHRPLLGGVSAHIHALRIDSPLVGAREVVIRRHGSAHWKALEANVTANEFGLLGALFTAGCAVPEPLLLDTTGESLPTPFMAMRMIEGTTEVKDDGISDAMRQMAEFLAQLHRLDASAPDFAVLPEREDPVAGALQYLPNIDSMRTARKAIATRPYAPIERAVLHGDFWPGNVLWNAGQLAAVIDWEDAAIGDPLSDFAACRAELLVAYGKAAMTTFTDHYLASNPLDTTHLALWEVYVSSAAIATMADWGLPPEQEQTRREQTAIFLERALAELQSGLH